MDHFRCVVELALAHGQPGPDAFGFHVGVLNFLLDRPELLVDVELHLFLGLQVLLHKELLAATFLVGTIAMLDLRLLGIGATNHRVSRIASEILPWTVTSAVISVLAGLPLFTSRATHYVHNIAFQVKMVFLLLAFINMLWFHLRTERSIADWDTSTSPITGARMAGLCSMVVWAGVVIGVLVVVGWLASKVIPGQQSDFILELPPMRMPAMRNRAQTLL